MAKNDNLSDLLKSVADGIRTKEGTTDLINPQDFQTRIENLPSGGGVDLTRIGYTQEESDTYNKLFEDGLAYAKKIQSTWDNPSALTNKFYGDIKLIYFPKVDLSNAVDCRFFCANASNLNIFPNFPNTQIKDMGRFCSDSGSMRFCGNIYKVSSLFYTFNGCGVLESIGIIDVENCTNFSGFLSGIGNLIQISITNYKQGDIYTYYLHKLDFKNVNYLIEHALGPSEGATQRTLTLSHVVKDKWQDTAQNPDYEKYAAMAAEKLITIA